MASLPHATQPAMHVSRHGRGGCVRCAWFDGARSALAVRAYVESLVVHIREVHRKGPSAELTVPLRKRALTLSRSCLSHSRTCVAERESRVRVSLGVWHVRAAM